MYTVTVTDDNGCIATAQDIVTEPAAPSMNITSSNPIVSNNPLLMRLVMVMILL